MMEFIIAIVAIAFIAFVVRDGLREQRMVDAAGSIGSVGGIHVDLLQESGAPSVTLTLVRDKFVLQVSLQDGEAKRLVEMLRLAAAPGRTLALARVNLRRRAAQSPTRS